MLICFFLFLNVVAKGYLKEKIKKIELIYRKKYYNHKGRIEDLKSPFLKWYYIGQTR